MLKHLLGTNQLVHQLAELLLCHAVHHFILMVTTLYEDVEAILKITKYSTPTVSSPAVLGLEIVLANIDNLSRC